MKKLMSVLLALAMLLTLATSALAEGDATYTYRGTYSGVSTWSPTDWTISSEYDMLGYTAVSYTHLTLPTKA